MITETHKVCQPTHLKISCFGCCGRNFKSKELVLKDIDLNTADFKQIKIPSTLRLLQFRDRLSEDMWAVMPSGVCSNVVKFGEQTYACPLHKNINKLIPKKQFLALHKKDLRQGHCDVNFECDTVHIFKLLSEKQKQEYLEWLKTQNLNDAYEYSTANVKAKLIYKFLGENYPNWQMYE